MIVIVATVVAWPAHAQVVAPPDAELTPLVATSGVHPGTTARLALTMRLPETFHVNSNRPRNPALIPLKLTIEPPPGVTVTEIVYPKATELEQAGATERLLVFEREFTIGVELRIAPDVRAPGRIDVPARLRYQACDDQICFFPVNTRTQWTLNIVPSHVGLAPQHRDTFDGIAFGHGEAPGTAGPSSADTSASVSSNGAATTSQAATLDDFVVLGTTGGALRIAEFLDFIHNAESGVVDAGPFAGRGAIAILLIVFAGGLALNLTPCVLPMIPINLAIIGAGAQAGSRRRGFLLGATYGAAMAVVYGVLGVVVILTAGTFGVINSSPWFNGGIAVLFVVLALAMFDVITIDFSRFSTRFAVGQSGRGTFVVAFSMGAIAALLAGACVAPVVIQVVLFASNLYSTGTTAALALPFVLGLGMALPWPIAGAGIAALPKPGAWMVRVKQVFGVLILATAVYYGYHTYTIIESRRGDPAAIASSVQEKLKQGWYASLDEGLTIAKRENKPVLIDLWATWCTNCLVMDKTTLQDPAVTAALAGYIKIKFQAEDLGAPATEAVMKRFRAVGLPTYVILKSKLL